MYHGAGNRYQAEEFGRFAQRLKGTPEPTGKGNMLDNTFATAIGIVAANCSIAHCIHSLHGNTLRSTGIHTMAEMSLFPGIAKYPSYLAPLVGHLGSRYSFVDEIARGKTGITYKLRSNSNDDLCFCLKTIQPEVTKEEARTDVRDNLMKEAAILRPLSHRCLPTIFESNFDVDPPFYICTYHPGETFFSFRDKRKECRFQDAVSIIWSLIDTLRYLHERGRTHCDLHTKNILISDHVVRDGILMIDFGSGHRQSESSPNTANRGNVNFKTYSGARLDRTLVDREQSQTNFEASDFMALGKVLAAMADPFLCAAATPSQRTYEELVESLLRNEIRSWETVEDSLLNVVDPFRCMSANMDIFLSESGEPQTIVVPGLLQVPVGEPSLAVINTKAFQRLRGIRQLSFCDWIFPGATHSRFEHSLGVFAVAKRAVDCLVHDRAFRRRFTAMDVRGFLLAALIHDVGHYPFAHVVEQYVAGRFPDSQGAKLVASHEAHARRILESDSEFRSAVAENWSAEALIHAIKTMDGYQGALSRLLDGPIDVDKVDYLTRDASHCGVRYGGGLDLEMLLRSLCCTSDTEEVGTNENGVPAVEGMMILQDQMLSQVYWNESVRGLIAMFHAILAHLIRRDEQKLALLVGQLQKCTNDTEAYEDVLLPMIDEYSGPQRDQLLRMVNSFENPQYTDIYRAVKSYRPIDRPHRQMLNTVHGTIVNQSTYSQSEIPINWVAVGKLRSAYLLGLREKNISASELDVVIDVPHGKAGRRTVKVKGAHSPVESDIVEMSHLKSTVFTQPAMHLSPVRVYFSPDVYQMALSRLELIIGVAEAEFAVSGQTGLTAEENA